MGEIINSKRIPDKKVSLKILADHKTMSNLKGHLRNVQVFNPNKCIHAAQINTRGNNGVTKYFRIPLSVRSRKKQNGDLTYQKIDTSSKTFYIYTLEK